MFLIRAPQRADSVAERADHLPARAMVGGWEVFPAGDGANIMVWWELQPKPTFLAPVLLPILAFQADRDFPKVIQPMADAAPLSENYDPTGSKLPVVRLTPTLC